MGYLEQILGDHEQIRFETRQHPFVFYSKIFFEVIVIVLLIAATYVVARQQGAAWLEYKTTVVLGLAGIALIVVISALLDYLRWVNERYVLTNLRVIHLRGIFNKSTIDSSLDKVNDVQMRQTILGRMFDYGDLEILTASEEAINRMEKIARPLDFKREMMNAKAEFEGYLRPPSAAVYEQAYHSPRPNDAASRVDLEATLTRLAELHQKGLITDDEFQQKRQEILSRI